jgi:hypothetical protein
MRVIDHVQVDQVLDAATLEGARSSRLVERVAHKGELGGLDCAGPVGSVEVL